jgi:hypothetical protein
LIYESFIEKMGVIWTVTGMARRHNFYMTGATSNRLCHLAVPFLEITLRGR